MYANFPHKSYIEVQKSAIAIKSTILLSSYLLLHEFYLVLDDQEKDWGIPSCYEWVPDRT